MFCIILHTRIIHLINDMAIPRIDHDVNEKHRFSLSWRRA
ncbi:hypothetical protein BN1221_03130c [Brenneria goodwinii]|uniref:Uncharacterized protein n=1 Tax=Brenneria goodwinii TaxID=1109412 RepID=A0A0G4JXJ9_9GAMM|nr:hypothetical protein BN1221_03130c [Brenneria goodwinii]